MTKRFGFTLAEVLITLGIIGVVAAMTMPTLMNSTNGAQYKTAYKKALSVLSQAVVLNVALDDYDLSQATSTATGTNDASLYSLFYNRMNVVKTDDGSSKVGWSSGDAKFGNHAGSNYTLFFNDGITFTFPKNAGNCQDYNAAAGGTTDKRCYGVIDVNGQKNPNKIVTCKGKTGLTTADQHDANCTVDNPTDIYPVVMYDQTILPNSDAGRAVLYGAGK